MGIAVGMSSLSCIRVEINVITYVLPVDGRHLRFPTYRTSDSNPTDLSVLPDPENMGIIVGISLLSRLKAEIDVFCYLLPALSRHIGYLVGAKLVLTPLSCSPAIFRKSH